MTSFVGRGLAPAAIMKRETTGFPYDEKSFARATNEIILIIRKKRLVARAFCQIMSFWANNDEKSQIAAKFSLDYHIKRLTTGKNSTIISAQTNESLFVKRISAKPS